MKRTVYPIWVSYKTRQVKIDNDWINVASHVDLNDIRVRQLNTLVFAEDLNGKPLIVEKINVD